jgi:microcystin degradation protein MlrC
MASGEGKRIAVGGLLFEGNTLSPVRNPLTTFTNNPYAEGEEMLRRFAGTDTEPAGALSVLAATGATALPLLYTHGGAGGRVTAEAWASLRDNLLARLRAALPVDGVYLALHGAMLTETTDDPEGELLDAVRELVGSAPVAVSCDMHAHVTMRMLEAADILVGYQLYPHDDGHETGQRATGLLMRMLAGEIRPRVSVCKLPMILQAQKQRTRGATPMRELYRLARALEASGQVLSASYFPVQPWMDVEDLGVTGLAITDGDEAGAARAAETLARAFWDRRLDFEVETTLVDEAIRAGVAVQDGFVVLADAADCIGGGARGDSAAVLARLLALAPEASAAVPVVDPETAAAAHRAGEGARIAVRLGNRSVAAYGEPLALEAEVVRLFGGTFTYRGGIMGGAKAEMGPSAWLRIGRADVVVATNPTYEYGDEQFQAAGFDPRTRHFVVVKNPMNYQQAFAGASAMFILDAPGPTTSALAGIAVPRARAGRPFWPFERDFAPTIAARPVRRRRND